MRAELSFPSIVSQPAEWTGELPASPPSLDQARRYCEQLVRSHYENFPIASLLLPRELRAHFYPVYAYCRWADDLGDETGDRARALFLLDRWEEELQEFYDNTTYGFDDGDDGGDEFEDNEVGAFF